MSSSRIPLHRIIRIVRSSVSLSLSRRRSLHLLIPFLPSTPPNPMLPSVLDVRKLALLYARHPTAVDTHSSSYFGSVQRRARKYPSAENVYS